MISAILALSLISTPQDPAFVHSPTKDYTHKLLGGFSIFISPAAVADIKALAPAIKILTEKINEINSIVPKPHPGIFRNTRTKKTVRRLATSR